MHFYLQNYVATYINITYIVVLHTFWLDTIASLHFNADLPVHYFTFLHPRILLFLCCTFKQNSILFLYCKLNPEKWQMEYETFILSRRRIHQIGQNPVNCCLGLGIIRWTYGSSFTSVQNLRFRFHFIKKIWLNNVSDYYI